MAVDLFGFIIGAQPDEEEFPIGVETADAGVERVGENTKGVVMKEARNIRFVVGEVIFIGVLDRDFGVLEFDEDERQAVDVDEDIGAAIVDRASNP